MMAMLRSDILDLGFGRRGAQVACGAGEGGLLGEAGDQGQRPGASATLRRAKFSQLLCVAATWGGFPLRQGLRRCDISETTRGMGDFRTCPGLSRCALHSIRRL